MYLKNYQRQCACMCTCFWHIACLMCTSCIRISTVFCKNLVCMCVFAFACISRFLSAVNIRACLFPSCLCVCVFLHPCRCRAKGPSGSYEGRCFTVPQPDSWALDSLSCYPTSTVLHHIPLQITVRIPPSSHRSPTDRQALQRRYISLSR